MNKVTEEQMKQMFDYINCLETALRIIRIEAGDDQFVLDVVDHALSYGNEED